MTAYTIHRAGQQLGQLPRLHGHGDPLERLRYDLAAHVADPCVLYGHVYEFSDGTVSIHPRDAQGRKVGRPYMLARA